MSISDMLLASSCRNPDLNMLGAVGISQHGSTPVVGFVYVITPDGHDVCKVGIALSVPTRLAELQCGAWAKLTCSAAAAVTHGSPIHIEQLAHRILKGGDHHLIGEWFRVDPQAAIEAVVQAAKQLGHTLASWGALKAEMVEAQLNKVSASEAARRDALR